MQGSCYSLLSIPNPEVELDSLRLSVDPTMLSQISKKYTEIVQGLLKVHSYPGFDCEGLATFKQNYGSSAFICRFPDCAKRSDGFASFQARDDHEKLRHGEGIKCIDPSCQFSKIGFGSAAALKWHTLSYHPANESVLPRRFKRKWQDIDPPATPPSIPGFDTVRSFTSDQFRQRRQIRQNSNVGSDNVLTNFVLPTNLPGQLSTPHI